jgi:hypothetical protein
MTNESKPSTPPVLPAPVSEDDLQRGADRITRLYHQAVRRAQQSAVKIGEQAGPPPRRPRRAR